MKSYSFIRENACKVVYPWSKDDESGPAHWYDGQMHPKPGSFSQYLYFIFAPTMLYRDYYPRCAIHILLCYALVYTMYVIVSFTETMDLSNGIMLLFTLCR